MMLRFLADERGAFGLSLGLRLTGRAAGVATPANAVVNRDGAFIINRGGAFVIADPTART